jgi:hypothetical protein
MSHISHSNSMDHPNIIALTEGMRPKIRGM